MENVVLIIHLLLALTLIGVVLMQRSEGGGLGVGGGGAATGRSAATALGKVTWVLAAAFIVTSISLTVIAAKKSGESSVLDRIGGGSVSAPADAPATDGASPLGDSLLPPSAGDTEPLVPRAD